MKKRFLPFIFTTAFALSITACGGSTLETVNTPPTETVLETEMVADTSTEVLEMKTETEVETEVEETESVETTEFPENALAFTVTEMSATKYAKSSVNVRKGPSSDYDKVGGLTANQEVVITGQADTGWYRIRYEDGEAFVSDKYLVDEKVIVTQTPPAQTNSPKGDNNQTGNTAPTSDQITQQQPSNPAPAPEQPATAPEPQPEQPSTPDPTPPASDGGNNGDMSLDDFNNMLGGNAGWETGGGESAGIGGDESWID